MKRIPELDALRGIAVLSVVLYHAYPQTFFAGWIGVDLFFVLSGFLISSVILEHVSDRGFFATFYFRRALRIWPIYYLTLLAVLALNAASPNGYPTTGLLWHVFFVQNLPHYWRGVTPPFVATFGPSWSVAVEEQFYLFWPITIWLAGRRRVVPISCALLAVAVSARAIGLPNCLLGSRLDGLALGSILAVSMPSMRAITAVGLTGAATLFAALITHWGDPIPRCEPIIFLAAAALFFGVVGAAIRLTGTRAMWPLRLRPLRWLGTVSYAMYMFHFPILVYTPAVLSRLGVMSGPVIGLVEMALILGLPAISYRFIEGPILTLKDRAVYGARRASLLRT